MLRFFSPLSARRSRFARTFSLESLETRDCPSTFVPATIVPVDLNAAATAQQTNGAAGPYTVTMNYTFQSGQNIEITGAVSGLNAGGQTIEFEGPIEGFVTTNADGTFDFTTPAAYLGPVLAAVLPPLSGSLGGGSLGGGSLGGGTLGGGTTPTVASNVVSETLVDIAPVISNFNYVQINSVSFEFTGQVTGTYIQGLTVTFGGQLATLQAQTYTATVTADGSFVLYVNLTGGSADTGLATAQIMTDNWGLQSNLASVNVASS